MDKRDFEIAKQFKNKLLENHIPVREIVVFGSRARGDANPDSDLDILVIVDERNPDIRKRVSGCAWEIGFASDIFIQSILRTKWDIEDGPEKSSLFFRSVQQEGIKV